MATEGSCSPLGWATRAKKTVFFGDPQNIFLDTLHRVVKMSDARIEAKQCGHRSFFKCFQIGQRRLINRGPHGAGPIDGGGADDTLAAR